MCNKISQLKEYYPFMRWMHCEDYHITLVFLGHVSTESLNLIKQELQSVAGNTKKFSLTLHNWGTFGQIHQPRILWTGIHGELELLQVLQKQVSDALQPLGFLPDHRGYNPHITVARKSQQENFQLQALQARFPLPVVKWQINEMILYQTDTKKTPRYQKLTSFPLIPN